MNEQTRISNDRREIDLISVSSTEAQKVVLQAETKSAVLDTSDSNIKRDSKRRIPVVLQAETKSAVLNTSESYIKRDIKRGIEQLEHFKGYLQRIHGDDVKNFRYSPAVALPNLSICFCNPGKWVKEVEISDNQTSNGASLDPYHGRKYQVCPRRFGCGLFRWENNVGPHLQCDLGQESLCKCGAQPITIEVPLQENKKPKKKPEDPKRFQVCQYNGCNFFRWLDQPEDPRLSQLTSSPPPANNVVEDQTFGNHCSKHFILKEHLINQEKQKVWWDQNCRNHTGNSTTELNSTTPQVDSLKKRLLTVSSMAFTRIPRLTSSTLTPNSILILMRQVWHQE